MKPNEYMLVENDKRKLQESIDEKSFCVILNTMKVSEGRGI